ncbi:MAG TPA: OmpH family outer membrane protein [Rhodanobacter sp.]|nr:OmpH family outer membrane protein [Rhodanobacter sp.]
MSLSRSLLVTSLIAVAGFSAVSVSSAQAAETLGGTPVSGVCLLSREAIFAQAKVGEAASKRLSELADQARTQLDSQRTPLDTDIKSFQSKESSLSEAQRKQQGSALQGRMQAFQTNATELNQRIQLTRAKVMQQIGQQAEPIVASSYKSHKCGLLLNRDVVLAGNMSNDLTSDVVQGLDRKITTISFNLEPLPAGKGK